MVTEYIDKFDGKRRRRYVIADSRGFHARTAARLLGIAAHRLKTEPEDPYIVTILEGVLSELGRTSPLVEGAERAFTTHSWPGDDLRADVVISSVEERGATDGNEHEREVIPSPRLSDAQADNFVKMVVEDASRVLASEPEVVTPSVTGGRKIRFAKSYAVFATSDAAGDDAGVLEDGIAVHVDRAEELFLGGHLDEVLVERNAFVVRGGPEFRYALTEANLFLVPEGRDVTSGIVLAGGIVGTYAAAQKIRRKLEARLVSERFAPGQPLSGGPRGTARRDEHGHEVLVVTKTGDETISLGAAGFRTIRVCECGVLISGGIVTCLSCAIAEPISPAKMEHRGAGAPGDGVSGNSSSGVEASLVLETDDFRSWASAVMRAAEENDEGLGSWVSRGQFGDPVPPLKDIPHRSILALAVASDLARLRAKGFSRGDVLAWIGKSPWKPTHVWLRGGVVLSSEWIFGGGLLDLGELGVGVGLQLGVDVAMEFPVVIVTEDFGAVRAHRRDAEDSNEEQVALFKLSEAGVERVLKMLSGALPVGFGEGEGR